MEPRDWIGVFGFGCLFHFSEIIEKPRLNPRCIAYFA
jgi:hypothetical protein